MSYCSTVEELFLNVAVPSSGQISIVTLRRRKKYLEIHVWVPKMNCVCFLGLLQFQRPQHPLSNGAVRVEEDSENEQDQRQRIDREMIPGTHSNIEEHIFEHLPPQLHRGMEGQHTVLIE